MKICAIGDPHGNLEEIKKIPLENIDLILLTGDLGSANLMRKMAFENIERKKQGLEEIVYTKKQKKDAFMEAYNSTIKIINYLRKFAPVYTIFGNVESSNKDTKKQSKKIGTELPYLYDKLNSFNNVKVINNKIINFQGIRIGGLEYFVDTNWVKEFKPTNYKKRMNSSKKQTNKAKKILKWFNKIDILISHQPPYKILDKVTAKFAPKDWQGKHAGSKTILDYIKSKSPRYVFCGHIHEGEGKYKLRNTEIYNLGVSGYKIIEIK